MKSLRTQFVFKAVFAFFLILILLFSIFVPLIHSFFVNTVTVLDQMECELVAEDAKMRLSEYRNITEGLAKNANLVDMLATCPTPESFNEDHNFPLIIESMARTQTENTSLWVFSLKNEYQLQTEVGYAEAMKISEKDRLRLTTLEEKMTDSVLVEYFAEDEKSLFTVITPIRRNGELVGLAGASIDLVPLLQTLQEVAAINNMSTTCTLLIPRLGENSQLIYYTELSLNGSGQLISNRRSSDYPVEFKSGSQHIGGEDSETRGEKYLSKIGSTDWYLSLFVTEAAISNAFLGNYLTIGIWTFLALILIALSLVALMAFHLTQPIHELDILVTNISQGNPYQRLTGSNEITRAADRLIDLVNDDRALLSEIKVMAKKIALGEIFTRFQDNEIEPVQNEIKLSLNQMLDSISYILDHLPLGVAILDEDYQLLYLNSSIRGLLEVASEAACQKLQLNQLTQLSDANRKVIARGIDECKSGSKYVTGKFFALQLHLELTTLRLDVQDDENQKQVFLQVFLNQTAVMEKVKEQDQIFAYFEHLSLVKKEALKWLSKGNFDQAIIDIGQRPSAPHLQEIYDNQLEMKRAFQDTVENIEAIIMQMQEATIAFSSGDLYATIDAQSAKGQYSKLVKTANTAFNVILSYFQSIPVPIRIIDKDYRIVFSNDASLRNGFCSGDEISCYNWFGRSEICCSCPYIDNLTELTVREVTLEHNGSPSYWRIYRNPLLDENNNVVSILEILIDETKIIELKKSADSANVAKSTFIASMSHEIRTPMNAILGYSQLLEMSQSLSAEHRTYVETIKHSGSHLLGIINEILELSKIESGKIQLSTEPFNLSNLLADVQSMFQPQMEAKGLKLVLESKPRHPHLLGDMGKIRQIIINLVSNSLKFTAQGQITLRVNSETMDDGRIGLTLDVIDTGSGISPEDQSKVFAAFEQTEAGIKSGVGTGLGMTISRNFAMLMGGDLVIWDSQVDKGSTFRLTLTLELSKEPSAPSTSSVNYSNIQSLQTPKTILVVESVAETRTLLQRLLERMGFTVLCAEDNLTALQLWSEHSPDAVSTDFRDDLELIQAIRAEEDSVHTPILVITASAMQQDKDTALHVGADAYLTKPLVVETLAMTLEALVGASYVFAEAEDTELVIQSTTGDETLPEELQTQIYQAVLQGNFDAVIDIANSVAKDCAAIAARLIELADDFDKDAICHLLEELKM